VDDVLFGSYSDSKIIPPPGISIPLKLVSVIDPSFQHDLFSERPWIASPLISAANTINVETGDSLHIGHPKWRWGGSKKLEEETSSFLQQIPESKQRNSVSTFSKVMSTFSQSAVSLDPKSSDDRRRVMANKSVREDLSFTPENIYNFEFFSPFVDFNTFDLTMGIRINMLQYINYKPFTYMVKSKIKDSPILIIEFALV
jgi:hypothetical protein